MRKTVDKRLTTKHKSVIIYLRNQNKIDDNLLVLINNLSLEDLIALKLELSAKMINNRLFGLDIWRKSGYIVKEALLMFAISTTQSKKDAARFLGLTYLDFKKALKKFEVDNYLEAAGIILAIKKGINLDSVKRPLKG